jgi:hypothetical protein
MRRFRAGSLIFASASLALALTQSGCASPAPKPQVAESGRCFEGQHFDGESCVQDGSVPPAAGPAPGDKTGETPPQTAPPAPTAPTATAEAPASPPSAVAPAESAPAPAPATGAPEMVSPKGPPRATPVDITMASAAGPLISYVASTHVPSGARPFGAPFAGQFTQGQVLAQRVQLSPGHCYTALAAGLAPVKGLRLGFYAADPVDAAAWVEPAWVLSEPSGTQAVLGRKENCFRPTASQADAWLLLEVTDGQGVAAAQIFEK